MRFVRNVFEDLVERRLAPVAGLLLLALVAVPLILSKSMPKDLAQAPVPSPAAADLSVPAMQPAVALSSPDGKARLDHLQALNPFAPRHVPAPPARPRPVQTTPTAPVGKGGGGQPTPPVTPTTPTTGGGTTPAAGTSTGPAGPSAPGHPAPRRVTRYYLLTVKVKFGLAFHHLGTQTLTGYQAIPSSRNPVAIFTGFSADRRKVQILVSDLVQSADGDATCRPSPSSCAEVYLRPRQTEFFNVATSSGGLRQYQLEVVSFGRKQVSRAEYLACPCRRVPAARGSRKANRLLKRLAAPAPRLDALSSLF
jgi:hypothetical protein